MDPVMFLMWIFGFAHTLYQCRYKEAGRFQRSDNPLERVHLTAACLPVSTPGDEVLAVVIQDVVFFLSQLALGSLHDFVWGVWTAKTIVNVSAAVSDSHANNKGKKKK